MGWRCLVLLVVLSGCDSKRRNFDVCCTTQADCEALGASDPLQCTPGFVCVDNSCIEQTTCQAESDCSNPTPFCAADGKCGACLDDSHCGGLHCDPNAHACVECVASSDCGNQVCDQGTHTCKPCSSNSECATGFCELDTHTCRGTRIVPRYVPNECEMPGAGTDLVVSADMFLDTTVDCNAGVKTQVGAPDICMVHYKSITIAAGATLYVSGPRAVALIGTDSVTVLGNLDVGAHGANGPGGGTVVSGGNAVGSNGAGGAGFATSGAAGGSTSIDGGAANGGGALADVSSLLIGGQSGGGAATTTAGGGGGGAATVIACRGVVSMSGIIDAGGSGGPGGFLKVQDNSLHGGGGGGSGGNVVLQGMAVTVTGAVYANGGGGGAGRNSLFGTQGAYGEPGGRSVTPAAGGTPGGGDVNFGGNGGSRNSMPGIGGKQGAVGATAGGGGGSVGTFQSFTPAGINAQISPSMASPDFLPNGHVPTK